MHSFSSFLFDRTCYWLQWVANRKTWTQQQAHGPHEASAKCYEGVFILCEGTPNLVMMSLWFCIICLLLSSSSSSSSSLITSCKIKITVSSFWCNCCSVIWTWGISQIKKVPSIFWCQGLNCDQMPDTYEMSDFSLQIPKRTSLAPPNFDELIPQQVNNQWLLQEHPSYHEDFCLAFKIPYKCMRNSMLVEMSLGYGTWTSVNASQYAGTNNILDCCICRTTMSVAAASSSSSSPAKDPTTKLKSDNENF